MGYTSEKLSKFFVEPSSSTHEHSSSSCREIAKTEAIASENPMARSMMGSLKGILPLAKSSFDVLGIGWSLPGHGEPYADCGSWRKRGCLEVENHVDNGLFENMVGKVYVEMYRRSCVRAQCPICYEDWAGKEAKKIEHRLGAVGRSMGMAIHLILSPSKHDLYGVEYPSLKKKAYLIARKSGFLGGSCMFHPWREDDRGLWYFSPHFHMIGYGWIHGTAEGYQEHGWIVKNARIRESISATAMYQLSHCGIHEKYTSVTWFGRLSYNKLRVPIMEREKHVCPICGSRLREVLYYGDSKLPEEEKGFWLDPKGWIYNPNVKWFPTF
jgi:hypothetical protein